MKAKEIILLLKRNEIEVSKDLKSQICTSQTLRNISPKIANSIIDMCELWKQYIVDDESFAKLVWREFMNMEKIQACVICSNPERTAYVGYGGIEVKGGIPPMLTTQVNDEGLLTTFDDSQILFHEKKKK